MNEWNEIGIWSSIREHGDTGQINLQNFGGDFIPVSFRPLDQGSLYWRHHWCNEASVTARLGNLRTAGRVHLRRRRQDSDQPSLGRDRRFQLHSAEFGGVGCPV